MKYVSKGNKMGMFLEGQTLALATSHQLNITANILEDRTKDDGDSPVGEFDNYTWGMTADSVVGTNEDITGQTSIMNLMDAMLAFEKLDVVTDAMTPATGSVPAGGWAENTVAANYPESKGEAYIESLSITAGSTGYATASVSFKGQGELS